MSRLAGVRKQAKGRTGARTLQFVSPSGALIGAAKWFFVLGCFAFMLVMLLFYYQQYGFAPAPRYQTMVDVRVKAAILSVLGGGMLAVAGVCLQKVTRNPLAEVNILGIGSINILFIFGFITLLSDRFATQSAAQAILPVVTLLASVIGTGIVYAFSISNRVNRNTFVIIGIALQFLFEALSVVFINPQNIGSNQQLQKVWNTVQDYTLGTIRTGNPDNPQTSGAVRWELIYMGLGVSAAIIGALLFLRKKIDIYEANEAVATSLGIRVGALRLGIYVMVAILAAVQASLVGTVALLGIIAPSCARLLFGNRAGRAITASFFIGATFVMLAQFISVNLATQAPPGILATAVAAPYFIVLIIRGR